ncbi:DUF6214 family protein [Streptomyces sp. NPDC053086]|uniref:DUF6214 family protein n=1 Tax=Streptomyces sp. NPDC053086 TaxID=3365698 RepID=UPI0037D2414E
MREHDGVTRWFHVRLAFPDGAGVDALAVVNGGRVSVEDVTARPALSLADLTALADWIDGPLSQACGVTAKEDRTRGGAGAAEETYGGCPAEEAYGDGPVEVVGAGSYGDGPVEVVGAGSYGDGPVEVVGAGSYGDGSAEAVGAGSYGDGPAEAVGVAPDGGCPNPRRARPVWPRGIKGRRLVAQEYRAARDGGADPVLAVMNATGHSRRRSLRLIAQARDAGLLAPRHARR